MANLDDPFRAKRTKDITLGIAYSMPTAFTCSVAFRNLMILIRHNSKLPKDDPIYYYIALAEHVESQHTVCNSYNMQVNVAYV
jgi:hypothetical protein